MLLPFKRILITAWLLLSSALALDITLDRIDRGVIDLSIGDITIHAPASWSIINNAISTIVGNLKVESGAGFYISLTSPILSLQVLLTSLLESIENDGIIAFNSVASLTSSTFNLVGLSFKNTGEMYMGASGILPSVMSITAASWDNENLMVFYQNQRNSGNVLLGTALGSITNNGNICLLNLCTDKQQLLKVVDVSLLMKTQPSTFQTHFYQLTPIKTFILRTANHLLLQKPFQLLKHSMFMVLVTETKLVSHYHFLVIYFHTTLPTVMMNLLVF